MNKARGSEVGGPVLLALSILLVTAGCFEPDREDYRDDAARAFCDRAQECDNLGESFIPSTHEDCVIEMRSRFNQKWPADECDQGRINTDDYERCMSRALDFACEAELLTRWDTSRRCRADRVCTDSPCEIRIFGKCLAR